MALLGGRGGNAEGARASAELATAPPSPELAAIQAGMSELLEAKRRTVAQKEKYKRSPKGILKGSPAGSVTFSR